MAFFKRTLGFDFKGNDQEMDTSKVTHTDLDNIKHRTYKAV
jgi:hypothetical protein